jgi:hypothetical protein
MAVAIFCVLKIVKQNTNPLYFAYYSRLFLFDYTGFRGIGNSVVGVLIYLIGRNQKDIGLLLAG